MENEATLPPIVRDPLIGTTIQERYRVIEKLGEGGMGSVYLGEHMMIKRKVAIKCLHGHFASHPEAVARFHREALAATAIGNEHIVEVTDMGTFSNGNLFMVLEYLQGHDFSQEIEQHGPLPLGRVANIACQMCDALTAVHAQGIVHRDLKPENIFLVPRGDNPDFVKILDFGISKFKNSLDGKAAKMTATGSALGTPYFMSPEQAEGRKDVDHQTDLYALGCIVFNALSNRQAIEGETLSMVILNICTQDAPSICEFRPDIPESFGELLSKLLAKKKADRFLDAAQLKEALMPYRSTATEPPSAEIINQLAQQRIETQQKDTNEASKPDENAHNDTYSSIFAPSSKKQFPLRWVMLGVGLLISMVLIGVLMSSDYFDSKTPKNATAATISSPATTSQSPAELIDVKIRIIPQNAQVFLDGVSIANPYTGKMAKSTSPRLLEARASGFETIAQELRLQFSQQVVLELNPVEVVSQVEEPIVQPVKTKKRRNKSGAKQKSDADKKVPDSTITKAPVHTPVSTPAKTDNTPDIKRDKSGLKSLF